MADNDVHNVVPGICGYPRYPRYPHQFLRQDEGAGQRNGGDVTPVTPKIHIPEKPQLTVLEVTKIRYLRVPHLRKHRYMIN